jgi:hypothetical protein
MMAAPISTLVDISTINYNNLNLIVKKAIEYVARMRSADREINGLSFISLPTKHASRIRISLKSSNDSKFSDEYDAPKTYSQQLTLACFLFSVSSLVNLGNRAHILCTNASGRGDLQMSISTKHCKSKLQERLVDILKDKDSINEIIVATQIDLPEKLSHVQRDLINQSTSGEISKIDVKRIKTNHSIDEIELFLELEELEKNAAVSKSQIPIINFDSFGIEEVIEKLRENIIAEQLQRDVILLSEKLEESVIRENHLESEIERLKKRNFLQRIFNR